MSKFLNEADTKGFPTGPVDSGKVTVGGVNGDWGGSMPRALEIARIAADCSGKSNPLSSQKRSRVKTASGAVSDHYEGNTSAYAIDIPARGKKGDDLLACIMSKFNNGSNANYKGGEWLNVNVGGYRYQFGWRVKNHYDHIHVGVKKIGGKIEEPKKTVTPVVVPKTPSKSGGLTQNYYKGEAKSNIDLIIKKLKERGITNPMVQAAILSVIGKESAFIPKNEIGYCNTDDSRIIKIFGRRGRKCKKKKCSDPEFFDCVYGKDSGMSLGNTQPGDGYKYRGRGFNGITGRAVYRKYGYESNPEALNNPEGAVDVMVQFLAKEGSSLNNRFKNVDEAVEFFTTRNAGGRRMPGEENKAKEVLSRFDIGSEINVDQVAQEKPDVDTEPKDKKSILSLLGLGDLDAMIALARGDEESFKKSTEGLKENEIIEEVYRIKDIMKKVL